MKKLLVLVIALAIISGAAFASDNQSAAYVRMLSREAATDAIDIAYFNPAGTAFLPEGFHVQLNNQTVYLNYEHFSSISGTNYVSENWVPFVPTAFLGYNGGQWAAFFSFTIPEGGGSLNFKDGAYLLDSSGGGSIEASSAYYGLSLGGSYRFGSTVSVSAHGTLMLGDDKTTVGLNLTGGVADAKASGIGFGGVFGINYRPLEELNIAVTVESAQTIEMEYTSVTDNDGGTTSGAIAGFGIIEGAKYDVERPWRIRTGLSYEFPFGLMIPVSFKYDIYKGIDNSLRNSWSTALAFRFWLNDSMELSLGGSYDIDEIPDVENYDPTNPELSSFTIAGGIGWEIIENMQLDIGVLYPIYFEESASGLGGFTDMKKQVVNIALGIGYVF